MQAPINILEGQIDYIYFVYGMAFIVLGVVSFIRSRSKEEILPWLFLCLFGFTHGLNEWLDMLAKNIGDTPLFSLVRLAVMACSFAFLVEFGRIGSIRLGMRSVRRWPVPILSLAGLLLGNLSGDLSGFNAGFRYSLGLVGCLWTAYVFLVYARRFAGARHNWLITVSVSVALYGIATGAIVPTANLIPANFLNQENFLSTTDVPIQLVRAFFAGMVLLAIWFEDINRFDVSQALAKRYTYSYVFLALISTVVGFGWILTDRLGQRNLDDLRQDVTRETGQIADRLAYDMRVAERLVKMISTSSDTIGLSRMTPVALDQLNRVVDRHSEMNAKMIAYILDRDGTVVSASNRNQPTSFVGKNYGFRPYFQNAITGENGQYFAVGVTTGEPGFYASAPIRNAKQEIVGVAVLKHTLDAETLGLTAFNNAYMIDPNGIVLLSGTKDAPYSLWPLPPDVLRAAQSTRQFAVQSYSPLVQQQLQDGDLINIAKGQFLIGRRIVNQDGWSVVALQQNRSVLFNRLFGILLTMTACVLIVATALAIQHEIGVELKMHANQLKLEELSVKLERQATTDALTGAMNRLKFDEVLNGAIKSASRYQTPLSLIMYDIDHFKRVNDTYGHQAGDDVLIEITRLVSTSIRDSDLLARWGGEEFMIVVPNASSGEAAALAEKLREMIAVHQLTAVGRLTCSFGVAQFVSDDTTDTLTARADQALYQAKTGGRNRVVTA